MPSLTIPPILAARITPLNASAIARWVAQLKSPLLPGDLSAFCDQAGLFCDETIDVVPTTLYSLGSYRVPPPSMRTHKSFIKSIDLSLFFGEAQLFLGNRIRLSKQHQPIPGRAFLPRTLENEALPFRSGTLPELLQLFGFSNSSNMAKSMEETLKICESDAMEHEVKACVASFEAMVDFAVSTIGTSNIEVLVGVENRLMQEQVITVKSLAEMNTKKREVVACHNAMFPYQVFYCHYLKGTKVFKVEMQTHKGKVISGVASCHQEFKHGQPFDELFRALKVKPGELICHWNFGDNVVWIAASSHSTNIATPAA